MYGVILSVLLLVAILLIVSVLLQAGTGGGLAAMGGGASTESFLGGRQATTILTKATWWLGGTFLFLSMVLAGMNTRSATPRSVLEGATPTLPAPVAPPPAVQLPLEGGQDLGTGAPGGVVPDSGD
jgi:preprotein translocase subunit SecG